LNLGEIIIANETFMMAGPMAVFMVIEGDGVMELSRTSQIPSPHGLSDTSLSHLLVIILDAMSTEQARRETIATCGGEEKPS
jgi:hypothetical protein